MDANIMERGYFTPNDPGILAETDSLSIQNAVDAALKTGLGRVVIPRYNKRTGACQWDVDKAIILDSNLEIVLDNCYIRQMDGSMDNVFRNFVRGQERKTLEQEQQDIIIRGLGNAVIDGGESNGLTEHNSRKNGLPSIDHNNMIFLHNLRNFRLEDFTLLHQRHWAINLCCVEEGRLSGLNIVCANDRQNQDGVDLRFGCNNIVIENMIGQSGDDFIALTAFMSEWAINQYAVEGKSLDIHDVIIRNIKATATECAVIALRNQDGIKIYNITIDTVHDVMTSADAVQEGSFVFGFEFNRYTQPRCPYALIRIGQDAWIRNVPCGPGDVHSIHVNNIHARCNSAIMLNMDIENSYFGNIYAGNGVDRIISANSCRARQIAGVNMRNTVFENIFYECMDNPHSIAFDFAKNEKENFLENVEIRNAYLGNCVQLVNMQHNGTLIMENIHGKNLKSNNFVREGATVVLNGEIL